MFIQGGVGELPELPEVETIKNELAPHLTGRTFTGVEVCDPKLSIRPALDVFKDELMGRKIQTIERRGKYLMFNLSDGKVLIMHLRMTGSLLLNPENTERYIRATFRFDDGSQLYFIDRRRLGVVSLVDGRISGMLKMGPEPLSDEFTPDKLAQLLKRRQAPIKAVLLDQAVIAGIGNMYADEALFQAGIHPLKKAGDLSLTEVKRLYNAIVNTLESAIGNKGASVDTYSRPGGEIGTAHYEFKVAHRRGGTCGICGTEIQRIVIRNRGTYFCPYCQKL
jgi:formamidopyrimidine-DNA glycosylase